MKNFIEKIKNKKELIFEIVAILLISLFSFSLAPKTLQNDTFYTVSIGNLIMDNGIDMKDHFTWHEDLPYTYPHWLYDVIMSLLYNLGGWDAIYISVCILSIILGITLYKVNKGLAKNQVISFLITIGVMYIIRDYIAARAQLVTFILFVLIIYFIEKFLENPKKIQYGLGIIISSTLIANLHVAVWPFMFVLYLPYIAEYIISIISDIIIYRKLYIWDYKLQLRKVKDNSEKVKELNKKIEEINESNEKRKAKRVTEEPYKIRMTRNKNVKWLLVIIIICAFTGLLTPLGDTPYTYLYKTMKGCTTQNINEHMPLTLSKDIPMMCTITIVLALIIFTKTKIRLCDLFMMGGLAYLMFSTKRQSTMFVLIGSVILNRMIVEAIKIYISDDIKEVNRKMINIITVLSFSAVVTYFSAKYINNKKDDIYVSKRIYPVEASEWMLANLDVKNIKLFNEYNYGSYLLYKGIPVFIDSRADLYDPVFNGSKDIFMDFINSSGIVTFYKGTFDNYGITHVILYKDSKMTMIIDKADSDNYNKIYSDDYFVIYEIIK